MSEGQPRSIDDKLRRVPPNNFEGVTYLAELTERVPTAAGVPHYVTIVREKAVLRAAIATATEVATDAYETRNAPVVQRDMLVDMRAVAPKHAGRTTAFTALIDEYLAKLEATSCRARMEAVS
jgi:replicative DNA helicase